MSKNIETRENNQHKGKEGQSSRSFLAGAFIGGVVGAAAALLFAPKSGKEIRNELNNQAGSLREKTTHLREDVMGKGNELATITKEKTAAFTKTIIQQSSELVNNVKNKSTTEELLPEEDETTYITIKDFAGKSNDYSAASGEADVRRKLEEAQKAFEDEENKIKQ